MPRFKLTLAYDGTDFCGWQKQFPHQDSVPAHLLLTPDASAAPPETPAPESSHERPRVELRTVQSVLERAVRAVVREPVHVMGASRTDAGVHAAGQVAAFTCSSSGGREGGWPVERGTAPLVRAINARLPDDVLVLAADVVPDDFEPVTGAIRKAYSYRLWTSADRPLWERRSVLHVWNPLDDRAMDAAARIFEGEHDFAGFAAAGHGRLTTVRTVFSCRVRRESPESTVIDIEGSGFLWNMVRIIAGTLVEVGKARMHPTQIENALRTGDRTLAGPTLPPHGLRLEWIRYRDPTPEQGTPAPYA